MVGNFDDDESPYQMAIRETISASRAPSPSLLEQCHRAGLVAPYALPQPAVSDAPSDEHGDDGSSAPAVLIGLGLTLGLALWISKKFDK